MDDEELPPELKIAKDYYISMCKNLESMPTAKIAVMGASNKLLIDLLDKYGEDVKKHFDNIRVTANLAKVPVPQYEFSFALAHLFLFDCALRNISSDNMVDVAAMMLGIAKEQNELTEHQLVMDISNQQKAAEANNGH